jgi:hypothetical protein
MIILQIRNSIIVSVILPLLEDQIKCFVYFAACPNFCSLCSDASTCTDCVEGYYLDAGTCTRKLNWFVIGFCTIYFHMDSKHYNNNLSVFFCQELSISA